MNLAERLNSALGDRYRIEKEIGSGGMATVFLAQDLKHDRAVAVKVLREDLAQSVGAERFLQEIRIVAKLQHPHILTLLDSGKVDDTLYYVMPYIEGESLREKLDREHELPVAEALRLLKEVADALAFAHGNGVVHRDIKPDNVLLTGRHALVADFGVSKALSAATGDDKVTTKGVALGTPAYMAPEQAAADSNIDHRADIYALGILGYELLTGNPPFHGTTPQQILSAQVMQAPQTVIELRPAVPEAVSAILMRCLEKRPADRWQTAEEVRAQFEALQASSGGITPTGMIPVARPGRPKWLLGVAAAVVAAAVGIGAWMVWGGGAAAGAAEENRAGRIIVMQLENVTGDPSLDPMGRLGASWIERALTQAAVAKVIPLQSGGGEDAEVARTASVAAVGDLFQAELVVTGEYYRRGAELEVVAHIMDPVGERTLFELQGARGDPEDPMDAFETIADQVVGAVATYYGNEGWIVATELYAPPPSLEAYRLYTEALEALSVSDYAESLAITNRIFALDSTWLSPLGNLPATYYNLGRYQEADSVIRYLDARRDRLTRLEQASLDWIHAWLIPDLELEYRAAMELVAADPIGLAYAAAVTCSRNNRLEEALTHLARRDMTTSSGRNWSSWNSVLFSVLVRLGRYDDALADVRRDRRARPEATSPVTREAQLLAALGRRDEVGRLLVEARGHPATAGGWSPAEAMRVATSVASGLGKQEDAAHYAQLALDEAGRSSGDTRYLRARALAYAQRWEEAAPLFRELLEETPESYARMGYLGWTMAGLGETAEAQALRDRLGSLELEFFQRGYIPYWQAAISTALGEHDRAISELQQAVRTGWTFNTWTVWYPWFRPLHDDPRYQALVAPK